MDWQQATALGIVAVTAVLFLRSWLCRPRLDPGRRLLCGCSGPACIRPPASLLYRAHKGRRPEVVWRFR